ncbi:MAG: enoyl-CoA hydratase/isomerase family protein [Clostridiales bacterium]|nr:enoyl-CoA hydratase/isomerase family protein [Clostridiales bacterium]
MEFTKVKYSVADRIATISMDSPKNMNAFDEVMLDELETALKMSEEDANVKCVLLNSTTSKAFSAGGDVAAMYEGIKNNSREAFTTEFGKSIAKMANVTIAIRKLSKPVVAAVQGACAGAGFNVALACDYVIATQASVYIQAFVKIGLVPDAGGIYLLTRSCGLNKGMELALTGDMIFADDAKTLGFVAEVIEDDDAFAEAAYKRAKKFTYGPSASYAYMKKLAWESEFKGFEEFVKKEVEAQMACGATDDFVEGVSAFCEKRRASFK